MVGPAIVLPPSLTWLSWSPGFRRLRRTAAGWIDDHFRLIEQHAPWLDPAGQQTVDFCVTSLQSRQGRIPRDPPGVQGHRLVRRVYTLDGRPARRLGELAQALAAVGWGQMADLEKTAAMVDLAQRHPPVGDFSWRPVPGFGLPPGLELQPPARQWPTWRGIHLVVDWGAPLSAEASGTRGRHAGQPRTLRSTGYWNGPPLRRLVAACPASRSRSTTCTTTTPTSATRQAGCWSGASFRSAGLAGGGDGRRNLRPSPICPASRCWF